MTDPVVVERDDAVGTVTLSRPDAMNSLDRATKDALVAAVREVADDPAVRCVVLAGTGRAFSVGQDLREHVQSITTKPMDEVWSTVDEHYSPLALALATMPKPVIAAVNGIAAGAGMSMSMACDLRLAADTAGFNTAFTGVALSCDTGCSWTLPRLVGPGRAMDLLLHPRTITADEAYDIGLVNRVVPADQLATETAETAARLAAGPTLAYASMKQAVAYAAHHGLEDALSFEAQLMARTGGSDDHRRAVEAFVAKQQPTFEGR